MNELEIKHLRFKLNWIADHAGELGDSDLDWAERMAEAFDERGFLTEKQLEVVEHIYRRIRA